MFLFSLRLDFSLLAPGLRIVDVTTGTQHMNWLLLIQQCLQCFHLCFITHFCVSLSLSFPLTCFYLFTLMMTRNGKSPLDKLIIAQHFGLSTSYTLKFSANNVDSSAQDGAECSLELYKDVSIFNFQIGTQSLKSLWRYQRIGGKK